MRLINTRTLRLEEFSEDGIPPYAILSHTWGNDSEELTFRQVENGETDQQNLGAIKLRGCCQQTQKDGLGYAWIDTCCIDKTNLVELSEAINSMYRWYSCSAVCYAYLSDVPDNDVPARQGSRFRSSRWFQRGWTLQELLAPKQLQFYNSQWRFIGTKGTICAVINNITRVPRQFLLGITNLHGASVAQRMSWAAQRQTKRAEDIAYCLLGIFNVTMPMIYGEGGKQAFFRLQEQIMKTTRDDSILAWGLSDEISKPATDDKGQVKGGEVLAAGPSSFATCAQIVAREQSASPLQSLEIIGGSVRVYLPLLTTAGGETYGLLSCGPGLDREKVVGIPLVRPKSGASSEYIRPMGFPSVLQPMNTAASPPELIHIKRDGQRFSSATKHQRYWIYEDDLFAQINLALVDVEPPSCWDERMNLISALRSDEEAADRILLRFRHGEEESQDFVMVLEVTPPTTNGDSPFHLVTCSRDTPLLQLVEKHRHILHKASGRTSASNGTLHLRITLEPVEEGLISINPHLMHRPPGITIDVSDELEKLNLVTEFTRLLRNRREEKEKEEQLHAKSKLHEDRLHLVKKEREAVEDQIQQLEEKKRKLAEEESDSIREIRVMEQQHEAVKGRRGDILNQLSRAFTGLANLQLFDDTEAGNALIEEVETHGDTDVFRLFDDRAAEALMMGKYGSPLIAASSRGDASSVRKILATNEVEIDRKDSKYGRTALSCASANGHSAVVQLLLNTGKVDVNSTDNNGWSPLRWASGSNHGKIMRLLIEGGARMDCQLTIQCQTDTVSTVAFSHDSEARVPGLPGPPDDTTRTWDGSTGLSQGLVENLNVCVYSVAFSSDSKLIASGLGDGIVKVWDSTTGERVQTLNNNRRNLKPFVAFSRNPEYLVSGSRHSNIDIWDPRTGWLLNSFEVSKGQLCVAISPDSRLVASGSVDDTIKIWKTTSAGNECLRTLRGHGWSVYSVVFSHDSRFIASGSNDTTVKIWDVATGGCLQTFQGHGGCVNSVVFSLDSNAVFSASNDKTVKIWDAGTGLCVQTLQGHRERVNSVAISHDAKMAVSGSSDNTIRLWDAETGQCLHMLQGHSSEVLSVALSHDSARVASGSRDGTIKLWDVSILLTMLSPSGVKASTSSILPSSSRHSSPSESLESTGGSQYAVLDAFDAKWREHFGQDLIDKGLTDDFIKDNQEFIANFLRTEQTELVASPVQSSPSSGHHVRRGPPPPPPPPRYSSTTAAASLVRSGSLVTAFKRAITSQPSEVSNSKRKK